MFVVFTSSLAALGSMKLAPFSTRVAAAVSVAVETPVLHGAVGAEPAAFAVVDVVAAADTPLRAV